MPHAPGINDGLPLPSLSRGDGREATPDASPQSPSRLEELNRRLRQAYVEGAEEQSHRQEGRGLTAEELLRVLQHYPGDVGERRTP